MTTGNVTAGKESVFGTMEEVTFSREGEPAAVLRRLVLAVELPRLCI